jgi:hypothetical protein
MADLAEHLREAAHLAMEVSPEEARRLQLQAVTLAALLAARAAELGPEAPAPAAVEPAGRPEWLNPAQVEATFGLPAAWLAEHARELERAGLVAKPSRKLRLYHRAKLGRWIEARRANPAHRNTV